MKPIKGQFHHRHLLFEIVFFSFVLLNVITNINQCLPPLDFPNSRLKRSIFLKQEQVNQFRPIASRIKRNQMTQNLISVTFLKTILKNRTETTVQARLKRA